MLYLLLLSAKLNTKFSTNSTEVTFTGQDLTDVYKDTTLTNSLCLLLMTIEMFYTSGPQYCTPHTPPAASTSSLLPISLLNDLLFFFTHERPVPVHHSQSTTQFCYFENLPCEADVFSSSRYESYGLLVFL